MKFSDFKSIEDVLEIYPLEVQILNFLPEMMLEPTPWFVEEMQFILAGRAEVESEMFYRESFISPFIRQAWKRHPHIKLWISRKLAYKDELVGEPDYFISMRPKGPTRDLVGKPLLAVAEAKQEDFVAGWGQCLAEMIACQKINADENIIIYGIVSAGEVWQFGKLERDIFTRNITAYTIHDPAKLLGVLDYLFEQCERQGQN